MNRKLLLLAASFVALPVAGVLADDEPVLQQQGGASYYADKFHGRKTATGETFSQNKMTAASRDLPLGTHVTVTNQENGKSVDVKVNDRGPYADGRVIDLSKKAAEKLDMKHDGVAPVTVEARPSAQPTEELKQAVEEKATGAATQEPPAQESSDE
ncbi:MAG TPA: septal ring lytic transglycosylase RlpA family protein [Stellaceae bacterium]